MRKYSVKYFILVLALCFNITVLAQGPSKVNLKNETLELVWEKDIRGYVLQILKTKIGGEWRDMDIAKYQHNILYASTKPVSLPQKLYDNAGREIIFPDPQYRYIIPSWEQNITSVALNTAGTNIVYKPCTAEQISDQKVQFSYENDLLRIVELWTLDSQYKGDICVTLSLYPKQEGYYSMASPSLVSLDKHDFEWATIPGIFQGKEINPNFVNAYAYGQGIPNCPLITKERTASTLSSIITDKKGITIAVTAEPGIARDPWLKDKKTHSEWLLGLSVMNRDGEFTPTLYHPILGERKSQAKAGDTISFSFRYTISNSDWYAVLKHAINDIYRFPEALKLKQTKLSLTQRLYDMYDYLTNDSTSKWHIHEYKGLEIGAQDYLGGVYGSEKDAMKNSDYGAMWMLGKITNDLLITEKRLPYALNFKLKQQHTDPGFFLGAAAGQYYLSKSKRFTEEWGPYSEPIGTTYYMLMDMGNILLFEPHHKTLKQQFGLAADKLLEWMKPEGRWEVAYDNITNEPMFTDVEDLRPTFYGMVIAYQLLKDGKYLDAAIKGANWYIENAVNKGHFLGVCGDTRFAPDFATVQSVQALLELYDITKNKKYKDAAISAAKIYTASVYTHPIPTTEIKKVKGVDRADWEISQAGLSFEHGGVLGSANHRGPILLASHAGMFVRMYSLTGDSLFLDMARMAVIGRDAFVDIKTGVASYYWDSMNDGAGPFPHHAWWQIGWIVDYLMSEANMRSQGKIFFPRGFIAPKVGPHQTYGFAAGNIFGAKADLIMRKGLFNLDNPYIEYITALDEKGKDLYLIVMNNDDDTQSFRAKLNTALLFAKKDVEIKNVSLIADNGTSKTLLSDTTTWNLNLNSYGLAVLKFQYK